MEQRGIGEVPGVAPWIGRGRAEEHPEVGQTDEHERLQQPHEEDGRDGRHRESLRQLIPAAPRNARDGKDGGPAQEIEGQHPGQQIEVGGAARARPEMDPQGAQPCQERQPERCSTHAAPGSARGGPALPSQPWQTGGVAHGEPALRAILLGASNLKISLPSLLAGLRQRAAGPVEALIACGHGRSYGTWSRFLFVRRLPGIADCGLWPALEGLPPRRRTLALLTDAGNDLVYGAGPEEIAGWIGTCLDRLAGHGAETVLTLLPLPRLEKLTPGQVRLAVSILFPGRPAPWPGLLDRARDLDDRLRRLGERYGVRLVEPEAGWYGLDPIHLRRQVRQQVWDQVLSLWLPEPSASSRGPRIPWFCAEEVRLGPLSLRTAQPALRLGDGTTVSFY